MAIIKCPECGRQISDKAPVCPNCGVQIAGKIIKCPQCGEVYFKDQEMCPICHHLTNTASSADQYSSESQQQMSATGEQNANGASYNGANLSSASQDASANQGNNDWNIPPQVTKKKHYGAIIAALIFALLVVGVCFYFYNEAKNSKEKQAYEFAMGSSDPLVLQTYLNTYKDAPEVHRDSIMAHIEAIKQLDVDWNNALVSGSKAAMEYYLDKHPESSHRMEAQHKIDSLDWVSAKLENTMDSYKKYLDNHANGEHVDEANTEIKSLKAKTVQPQEKQQVTSVLRRFFQSINARSESGIQSTVTPVLTDFLGKENASQADVVTFMNKIYKEDITNMNWHLTGDYKIDKKEVGDEEYEYYVQCSAVQDIERTDADKEKTARYRIKATVSPDGKISAMSMVKILQ
jgi:RNA polymerase subunit RPABC4/transcription elongation factor Spt4